MLRCDLRCLSLHLLRKLEILDQFGQFIMSATKDPEHTGPSDAPWYRPVAAAEGWIVLATDATVRPRNDSVSWRLALLAAGLDIVYHEWPKSANGRWRLLASRAVRSAPTGLELS